MKLNNIVSVFFGSVFASLALCTGAITEEDVAQHDFAALGHPMYHMRIPENEEEHGRMLQSGCQSQVLVVKTSEYNVDYMGGSWQYGVAPIYRQSNTTVGASIGKWFWDWALSGTTVATYRAYGTMMVEYDPQQSVAFGFSNTQTNYPVTGGYLNSNSCPNGYVTFNNQIGDTRYYRLYLCSPCSN